ncbi:hypothetical protein FOXYSP1_15206 [Fusarium oxysporum f. sp. phaseoli]
MQPSTLYTFPIPIEFENPLLYAMDTNQTPAVSQAASTESDREEWLGAMAEHAKYEAFRNRIRNFLLNLDTMRESLQINSRIAGPDTELGKAMVALSDEMFDKMRKMDKGVTVLNKIYTEVDLRKPLIEAHLELGAGSAAETLAETQPVGLLETRALVLTHGKESSSLIASTVAHVRGRVKSGSISSLITPKRPL